MALSQGNGEWAMRISAFRVVSSYIRRPVGRKRPNLSWWAPAVVLLCLGCGHDRTDSSQPIPQSPGSSEDVGYVRPQGDQPAEATRVGTAALPAAPATEPGRDPASTIDLQLVARLDDPDGRPLLNTPPAVVQDHRGNFILVAPSRDALLAFDRAGTFQARIGRRGQAEGEFQRASRVLVAPDDSIFVYDSILKRGTRFGPDRRVAEVVSLPYAPDFLLETGEYIVAEQIPTPELIGHPVHRVAPDGIVARSFGAETPQYRPDLRLAVNRLVAPASDGGVWTVAPGRYVIERWDPVTGSRLAQVTVRSTWFQESARLRTDERQPPNPIIEALWEEDGLLWVLLRDADTHWRAPAAANTERPHDPAEYDRSYDWVLDAVTPHTGTIVASRRFDEVISASRSLPLIATSAAPSALNIWRARLVRKGGGE